MVLQSKIVAPAKEAWFGRRLRPKKQPFWRFLTEFFVLKNTQNVFGSVFWGLWMILSLFGFPCTFSSSSAAFSFRWDLHKNEHLPTDPSMFCEWGEEGGAPEPNEVPFAIEDLVDFQDPWE